MSDQAQEQSLSIEERMMAVLEPEEEEVEETESEEAAPQDNGEEAEESEEVENPEEDEVETEEEAEEPDLVEIEVDGESFKVPEVLKDKFMLQADYTRKTQEVAEQRKLVEQAQAQLQTQAQLQQQNLEDYAKLIATDKQLQGYQQVDWNALYDSDPAEFVRLKEAYRELKDSRTEMTQTLTMKQQQQIAEQQSQLQRATEEGNAVLTKEIPNWNPTKGKEIKEYAVTTLRFKPEELNAVTDPRVVIALYKAQQFDKLKAGKSVTEKKVQNLPKVSKPGSPSNKTINKTQEEALRKNLRRTGSTDDAAALFLSRIK
jgi:hypothetical protein